MFSVIHFTFELNNVFSVGKLEHDAAIGVTVVEVLHVIQIKFVVENVQTFKVHVAWITAECHVVLGGFVGGTIR